MKQCARRLFAWFMAASELAPYSSPKTLPLHHATSFVGKVHRVLQPQNMERISHLRRGIAACLLHGRLFHARSHRRQLHSVLGMVEIHQKSSSCVSDRLFKITSANYSF